MDIEFGSVGVAKTVTPTFRKKGKNSKSGRRPTYEERPFVAWDGEGYNDAEGRHHYFLFGNSDGLEESAESLGTYACLRLMLKSAYNNKSAIHIGFAFDYDVNMILGDLGYLNMRQLKEKTFVWWRNMRIEHIPRKWFQVTGTYMGQKVTCRIQDVFSYYAMSFVKALKKNGIGTDEDIAFIEAGKEKRGEFRMDMLDEMVRPYWQAELKYLVQLADNLRDSLYSAGIRPTGWYGPGNVASYVFKAQGVEGYMNSETPKDVLDAAAYAYAGGRFEAFRVGFYDGPVYSADINSAYPHALRYMPDLKTGNWESVSEPVQLDNLLRDDSLRMGLFYMESRILGERTAFPYPKFHRVSGGVCWPRRTRGWVFSHEARIIARSGAGRALRGLVYQDDGTNPFSWVAEMYEQRKQWQQEGNPAEKALKLCLNSCYGKFAQRIGWNEETRTPPRWHQILWAGSITSHARSMLYSGSIPSAMQSGLIAVETDGIYSTVPFTTLPNGTGEGLGEWKVEEYSGILYLQSGVYWLRDMNGKWQPPKSRGIPQKHLNIDDAFRALSAKEPLSATQSRFHGYGMAVHRNRMDTWRRWENEKKEFSFGGDGKRKHLEANCLSCKEGAGYHETLHNLTAFQPKELESEKHDIPWEAETPAPMLTQESRHDEKWSIEVV